MSNIAIIGSGFSSLTAACFLVKSGHSVTVFEKNDQLGGRARQFTTDGFVFDMGPSWYWMPEVFEQFFNKFGKKVSDYYQLEHLDPSYSVIFDQKEVIDMPADYQALKKLFDSLEPGAGQKLDEFLAEAEYKYKVGMEEFVWKPGTSIMEFADIRVFTSMFKLDMLTSVSSQVRKLFKNDKIRKILEFPVLFLGATPQKTPALYTLMNYADLKLGTWYPQGGMYKIVEAMVDLGRELGVKYITSAPVEKLIVEHGKVVKLQVDTNRFFDVDYCIAGADYHHIEQEVLDKEWRMYDEKYWENRTMAPSSLLFYIGLNKKITDVRHHKLCFDRDFDAHAQEIYESPKWPSDPLFYLCCPSVTDQTVAPEGFENIFLLMPLAPGLEDNEKMREKYFDLMCKRIHNQFNIDIKSHIVYYRSYCVNDFKKDYHAYKGNAYGLANTLKQTAFLKPKMVSQKVKQLFYTGQLTTPGPGMPPAIVSGEVVAHLVNKASQK